MTSESRVKAALREKIKLSSSHRGIFYLLICLIWLTGAAWLVFENGIRVSTSFGTGRHWAQSVILWVHGIVAYGVLLILGSFSVHVKRGLALKVNLSSGIFIISVFAIITLSGLGLYYISNEQFRALSSLTHWIVGLPLPLFLFAHIWNGRRQRSSDLNKVSRKA